MARNVECLIPMDGKTCFSIENSNYISILERGTEYVIGWYGLIQRSLLRSVEVWDIQLSTSPLRRSKKTGKMFKQLKINTIDALYLRQCLIPASKRVSRLDVECRGLSTIGSHSPCCFELYFPKTRSRTQ